MAVLEAPLSSLPLCQLSAGYSFLSWAAEDILEVNEESSEAAAVTFVSVMRTFLVPEPVRFTVDPSYFCIFIKKSI